MTHGSDSICFLAIAVQIEGCLHSPRPPPPPPRPRVRQLPSPLLQEGFLSYELCNAEAFASSPPNMTVCEGSEAVLKLVKMR